MTDTKALMDYLNELAGRTYADKDLHALEELRTLVEDAQARQRPMTRAELEDMATPGPVWVEALDEEMKQQGWQIVTHTDSTRLFLKGEKLLLLIEYGLDWRAWRERPTYEQRMEALWEEEQEE